MTQEEKSLLLKDLCARLPYGVMVFVKDYNESCVLEAIYDNLDVKVKGCLCYNLAFECKPYLRPMSSMTEKEQKEFAQFHCVNVCPIVITDMLTLNNEASMFDWLNKKMFDYRGLIPMGLVLEAPVDMYNTKTE